MKTSLDYEEKGILKYLGRTEKEITLENISAYLINQEYDSLGKKALREKLDKLIDLGYVRSKTKGIGNNRKEVFYLSNYLVGGVRKKMDLQGRGILSDTSKLIRKLLGAVFLLIGIGFFVYEGSNMTGAVISSSSGVNPMFFFALTLGIIGFLLLINSFKKR